MSINISRRDFDKCMIPIYTPAKFIPIYGKGSIIWDQNNNDYIDFTGGIAVNALGHAHPQLQQTLQEQAANLWHTGNGYTNEPILRLAKQLIDLTFAERVFFCNSGAEANEAAMKLARKVAHDRFGKNKRNIISFINSFHGRTLFTVAAGGKSNYSKYFTPLPKKIKHALFNDIESIKRLINHDTCAVIIEPIQGEGGVIPAQKKFLHQLRNLCNIYDSLLIFDEVQSGIGRTGYLYSYMHYDVVPDILTSAKALGGGFPIGALLTTEDIAISMSIGTHGTTYGGNPLAGAVSGKVIELINKPEFMIGVKNSHDFFIQALKKINNKFHLFKEIRGLGLMIGAELNSHFINKSKDLSNLAAEERVMVLIAGTNVIRFTPALNISLNEIDIGMERFTNACKSFVKLHS
ncbi:MAG: acetylornithine/succinylornithine family transaminase [Pantoea sp. Brub]|nr:acetylornithine/succinylornithine family transaminase [Pantoea sp. Brub]